MTILTIGQDNNITAFASAVQAKSNPEGERFRSAKELDNLARKWPASRFMKSGTACPA